MNKEYTIILDASHGGEDLGNTHEGFHEKDYTLYVVNYLEKALESTPLNILKTRVGDETIPPFTRISEIKEMMKNPEKTIILSLHAHFDDPDTWIIYSMYDQTNLATEIYRFLKESSLNIKIPTTKLLPADWQKDYHFIHRELGHHPTIILDCFFDIENPEDHCGLFASLIVKAILKYIQSTETRSSYTVKKGDSLYSIASSNNTTVEELKKQNNLSSNLLSIGQILELPDLYETKSYFLYTVKAGDNLYAIARKYNTSVAELQKLNFLTSTSLSIGQVLKIPLIDKEKSDIILPEYTNYVVKKGDSLYSIAQQFNTTVSNIMKNNNLSTNALSVGQVLKIETSETTLPIQESCYGNAPEISESTQQSSLSYTVQKGDSLYLIAKKYNTSIAAIIQENNLSSTILSVGQTLNIPVSSPSLSSITYIVQKGDSLYSISKKYNTTVEKIKMQNQLTSNVLAIGQELTIERRS